MSSWPANDAVPSRIPEYCRGGEKLLKGVRDMETMRETDLCWTIARFYGVALNSNRALGKALEIFDSLDALLDKSNLTSDESARLRTRADLQTCRNALGFCHGGFKRGLRYTVEEFKEEQGADEGEDSKGKNNTVEGFKEEQGEDEDEDEDKDEDSEMVINAGKGFKEEQGE